MTKRIQIFFAIVLCFGPQTGLADHQTVGEFTRHCGVLIQPVEKSQISPDPDETSRCVGYVDGLTDGMVTAMDLTKAKKLFCLPQEGLSLAGNLRMIKDFINSKKLPDDTPLKVAIAAAYTVYFPCIK